MQIKCKAEGVYPDCQYVHQFKDGKTEYNFGQMNIFVS